MAERAVPRRVEYSEATRSALLDSALRLFISKTFASTSLDEVAADARVTKGAVYHHFANKKALFQAVLELVDQQTMDLIVQRTSTTTTTWDGALAGLDAFLDRCLDPIYQQICFVQGPSALGFVPWWQHGESHVEGLLNAVLHSLRDEGVIRAADIDALSTALYGALTAGALAIARAHDPSNVRHNIQATLLAWLEGLRIEHPGLTPPP
jgi:AcrR family transcriptional regulator